MHEQTSSKMAKIQNVKYSPRYEIEIVTGVVNRQDSIYLDASHYIGITQKPHDHLLKKSETIFHVTSNFGENGQNRKSEVLTLRTKSFPLQ